MTDDYQPELPDSRDGHLFDFGDSNWLTVDTVEARIGSTVVPVLFRRGGAELTLEGTAFCIASSPDSPEALYATARHVVESLDPPEQGIEPYVLIAEPEKRDDGTTHIDLHNVWVSGVSMAESFCDVAVLVVDRGTSPTAGILPSPLPLSLAEPLVGQHCTALGYPQKANDPQYILQASRARIEEVHPSKRDSHFSTFPSFRTRGNYLHGMSGGPVISDDGHVIGLISSGMDVDDDQPIGYGACIASIMELTVNILDGGGIRRDFKVADLITEGYIHRDGPGVSMKRTPTGVELRWNPAQS